MANFTRCASPPERVLALLNKLKYPTPTLFKKLNLSFISFKIGFAISESVLFNLIDQGSVLVFGNVKQGQMGRGEHIESPASYRTTALHIDSLEKEKFKGLYIAASGSHSFVFGVND